MPDSGGGSNTTTQKFEPPDYTKGLWENYVNAGSDLTQREFTPYPFPRIAPLNEVQNMGLQMGIDNALNSDPSTRAARGAATDISQGSQFDSNPFLNTNPWLDATISDNTRNMAQAHAIGTAAQNDAAANMQGAYGGSAWALKQVMDAQALDRNVGQMANQARFQDFSQRGQQYSDTANRQMQAIGMAPQWANLDQQAVKMLTGAGDAYQQDTQRGLDQMYEDYLTQLNYPMQQLENLGSILSRASGTYAGGGTQTQTGLLPGQSGLGGLLGLGAGAYGISQLF